MGQRVKLQDLALFTRQLSAMVEAGIPIPQALNYYARTPPQDELRRVVDQVAGKVFNGARISHALRDHPSVFSEAFVAMIESAETSGRLNRILAKLSDLLEKQLHMAQRIVATLTYPLVLVVVSLLCVALFLFGILPMMKPMFQGQDLPWPTRLLLASSEFLLPCLIGVPSLVLMLWLAWPAWRSYLRDHPPLRSDLAKLPFSLPIVGKVLRQIIVARIFFTLSSLLEAGLPILSALPRAAAASSNFWVEEQMAEARNLIMNGEPVSKALDYSGVFPSSALHLLAAGEESSSIAQMSGYLAELYEEEAEMALTTLANVLEPLIMLGMGLLVGFVIVSAMLPMVQVIDHL